MDCVKDPSELVQSDPVYDGKSSLLSKYQIPLHHLDLKYVESCKDGVELEKILRILKSGQEGFYPDLTKAAEARLACLKPKSKLLRKSDPVLSRSDLNSDELLEISTDLDKWLRGMSKSNKELESRRTNSNTSSSAVKVRKFQDVQPDTKTIMEKRISSTDYPAWDKYDPDTEILKMDLSEETMKKAALAEEITKNKAKPKKTVSFNKFATEAEARFVSDREREKGNEFFKTGEYEEAVQCYTNSITSKTSATNLNNRAITHIKLKRYRLALDDCEKALRIDPDNLKSHLRRAQALEGLGLFKEALECVEELIRRHPNNAAGQELAARVRNHCEAPPNMRMKIVEIN